MCLLLLIKCVCYIFLKQARVHLLDTEPFEDAFGPKTKRKRPRLLAADYESLAKKADGSQGMLLCFSPSCHFVPRFHLVRWSEMKALVLTVYLITHFVCQI